MRKPLRAEAVPAEGGDALADAAYQAILAEIFGGRMRSGESISEVELARRLGMSRTPVHQAVRELVRDGLLTQAPSMVDEKQLRELHIRLRNPQAA